MNASLLRFLGAIIVAAVVTAPAWATAPSGRYTITAGTVYDTKTKLTWQQPGPSATYTWAAAKTYCAGLGSSLGGTGWRLPTIKELQTIVDNSKVMNPRDRSQRLPRDGFHHLLVVDAGHELALGRVGRALLYRHFLDLHRDRFGLCPLRALRS